MSSEPERNSLQRTVLFGMLFLFLLLIAVLAGYMFLGKPPEVASTPPPVDDTTPSVTPDALPPAPSDLTAENVAVYDILVGWKDNSNNEDGFNVYRQRTDVPGDLMKAGSTGANETKFIDPYTYCGETYEYIVASYNSLGESPTEVCWSITLPPCPETKSLTEDAGVDRGYNFLTGAVGPNSDFYLASPADVPLFIADQTGQFGLVDLGDVGDMPLWHVNLPQPTDYARNGIETLPGHTYAALATDGASVVVSTVESIGQSANLKYIVWRPGDEKTGECTVGRQGRDPTPPRTCECREGRIVVGITAASVPDPRCRQYPDATCECHGDDLVFSSLAAVYPRDPICTGQECACQGPDWVCSDGFIIQSSARCVEETEPPCVGADCVTPTVSLTETPPSCECKGTTLVCSDGTNYPNSQRCLPVTQQPTEPPNQNCYCEVANNAWNGDWVCVNADTGAELSRVHDEGRCPVPVCGNGVIEGNEQCDGGSKGCEKGASCRSDCTCTEATQQTCTCVCVTTGSGRICRDSCTGQTCRP